MGMSGSSEEIEDADAGKTSELLRFPAVRTNPVPPNVQALEGPEARQAATGLRVAGAADGFGMGVEIGTGAEWLSGHGSILNEASGDEALHGDQQGFAGRHAEMVAVTGDRQRPAEGRADPFDGGADELSIDADVVNDPAP
jgi:hypothetical protein